MPKRIPIKVARTVGRQNDCRQVILFAWDGTRTHCLTWGKTVEDCSQAADGGNRMKKFLGWPDSEQAQPARVLKLQKDLQRLAAVAIDLVDCVRNQSPALTGFLQLPAPWPEAVALRDVLEELKIVKSEVRE